MQRVYLIFCLLLPGSLVIAQPTQSEPEPFQFDVYDGLPSDVSGGVLQDSLGYVWMGSYGGLVRYTGFSSEVMYDGPVLPFVSGQGHRMIGGFEELVIVEPLIPQITSYALPAIRDAHGIEQPAVLLDVRQDGAGEIWAIIRPEDDTSQRFLYRFNQASGFRDLTPVDRYPETPTCMAVDVKGAIWIGTATNGLYSKKPDASVFEVFTHLPSDPTSLSHNGILSILPAAKHPEIVWIGAGDEPMSWDGSEGTLNKLDTSTGLIHRLPIDLSSHRTPPALRPWAMEEYRDGDIWIGGRGEIHRLDPTTLTRKTWTIPGPEIHPTMVTQISTSTDHSLWLGVGTLPANRRVFRFEPEKEIFQTIHIPESLGQEAGDLSYVAGGPMESLLGPSSLFQDSFGTLWAPSRGGLLRAGVLGHAIQHVTPPADNSGDIRVRALFADRQDRLWIGSQGAGVALLDISANNLLSNVQDAVTVNRLRNGYIQTIFLPDASSDIAWIGTGSMSQNEGSRGGSLVRLAASTGTVDRFTPPENPYGPHIQALLADGDNGLWVGRTDGFFYFSFSTGSFEEYRLDANRSAGSIKVLARDSSGSIWMGTRGSDVLIFDPNSEKVRLARSFDGDEVNAILPFPDGNIWMGTDGGLFSIPNPRADSLTFQPAADSLNQRLVQHILRDTEGFLWVASNTTVGGQGTLSRLVPETGAIDSLRAASRLTFDIWFRPPAGAQAADGRLFFGGDGGIVALDPSRLLREFSSPTLALSSIRIHGKRIDSEQRFLEIPVALAENFDLRYDQDDFQITFAGLHTADKESIRFTYRLDGYDNQWRDAGNRRSVEYYRIRPGTYTFRLRARTEYSAWSPERTLQITMHPPWWRTASAWVIYGLMLIGLGVLIVQILRRQAVKKEREKMRARELAQARKIERAYAELQATQQQLLHAEKMSSLGQLTSGIAHEVNNPINFVSSNITPLRRDIEDLHKVIRSFERDLEESDTQDAFSRTQTLNQKLDTPFLFEEIDHLLDGIEQGAHRTAEIVRLLQHFSRDKQHERIPTDLHDGIDAALLVLNNQIEDRIVVTKDYGELPEVCCYADDISQVFLHLLTNAVQAIDGQGKIEIRTWRADNMAVISITDSGPGIPDTIKDRIFDPFFTTHDVGAGSGLGLYISHQIIEEHHGSIEMGSEPDVGTQFVVALPVEG